MKNIITTLAVLAVSSAFTFAADEKPAEPAKEPAKPTEPAKEPAKATETKPGKPEKKDAFAMKDADGDGAITKEEYVAGAKNAANAEKAFAKLDKDADGKVTKEEFTGKGGKAPAKKTK